MRKNHPNFRRDVKNLWKKYQRDNNYGYAQEWFEERGIICYNNWIPDILKTNISSKIFTRLGKAALKRGKLVDIIDILKVWRFKNNKSYVRYYKREGELLEYHKIHFYIPALQEETTYKMIYTKEV
jgi:hypothetical protein